MEVGARVRGREVGCGVGWGKVGGLQRFSLKRTEGLEGRSKFIRSRGIYPVVSTGCGQSQSEAKAKACLASFDSKLSQPGWVYESV